MQDRGPGGLDPDDGSAAIDTRSESGIMGDSAGDFEKLVLLAVLRLGRGAYGAAIIEEMSERTGRQVSPGATYVALRRLEDKGMLRSRKGDPTPERGGRAKRYYEMCADGLEVLRSARRDWDAMAEGLESLLESGP